MHNLIKTLQGLRKTLRNLSKSKTSAKIKETVKTWIDSKMDHRMILSREDPLIPLLEEAGQPIYVMEDNPTAENIAKLVFNQVKSQGIDVKEIRLWETPTSYASYSEMS